MQIKKPNLEDAAAGAFMAGADFVAPKKNRHEPLIKFLGKRAALREQVGLEFIVLRAFLAGGSPGDFSFYFRWAQTMFIIAIVPVATTFL